MKYTKIIVNNTSWVITETGKDYKHPIRKASYTFAFDTETLVFLDGVIISQKELYERLKDVSTEDKRKRVSNKTWAFQVYDEYNGFFMTNDFLIFCNYICLCGYKYGWCYNATFDFAQIDYEILANGRDLWKPHDHDSNTKAQPFTYESLHNNTGCRYAYKLWIEYKNEQYHKYTHAVELRDFMKLVMGGLRNLLKDLDVRDNDGKPIRKLDMEYQAVDTDNLTEEQIDYCCNDVKGLYFAVKKFNETIIQQSNGESRIYGKNSNIMTSGGFAKREMLRSLYPYTQPRFRIKKYQREHPITEEQDKFVRNAHLYRGGITYLNPYYKGKLITDKVMYRYDVNSEYPYAMASIRDLIGYPFMITFNEWRKMKKTEKDKYECIYMLESVSGSVKPNMLGIWYNPFTKDFEDEVIEEGLHLIFERELEELYKWYDLDFTCNNVILLERGRKAYKQFIEESYKVKAQAKKDKNKTLEKTTKIKLNSSYGKLAERVERIKGHYELNEETGAIHFVEDETEIDSKTIMSVFVGSLVTCFARCYILSKIREICKNPSRDFVYIDTDSIHCFNYYDKNDAYALGGLKLETTCDAIKYIAPKTYIDVIKVKDGKVDINDIEIHSKGISLSAIMTELKDKTLTLNEIDKAIAYGKQYCVLCAMNVKGGKVLLPTDKYIARWEQAPKEVCYNGNDSLYLIER